MDGRKKEVAEYKAELKKECDALDYNKTHRVEAIKTQAKPGLIYTESTFKKIGQADIQRKLDADKVQE